MSEAVNSQFPTGDEIDPSLQVAKALASLEAKIFYEKPLTPSDASGSGRIVIPKAIAEMYFPILENQSGISIDAVDTIGNTYFFRFRFWINNQSRMYLLEGATELQKRYNLSVNDVMIFANKPDKTLVVAGRPSTDVFSGTFKKSHSKKNVIRKMTTSSGTTKRDQKRNLPGQTRSSVQKKMRKSSSRETQLSMRPHQDFNPFLVPADGVFRFLLNSNGLDGSSVFVQSGVWTAVLDIKGEMYQAFFDSQNDAITAFNAAGYLC